MFSVHGVVDVLRAGAGVVSRLLTRAWTRLAAVATFRLLL